MNIPTTKRIHVIEIAPDVYAAVTPAQPLDITDAGMMNNFSNSAYIDHGKGLVCDTYYDLPHARELREFCIQKSGHAPGYVVNTHGHWDHIWGNQIFPEAAIFGHEGMLTDCANDRQKLKFFRLLNNSAKVQHLADHMMTKMFQPYLQENQSCHMLVQTGKDDFDLNGIILRKPNRYFQHNMSLDLDGLQVQFLPMGALHSSSDTVVWIPSRRVLFAGDLFADCSVPTSLEQGKKWVKAMDYILDELNPDVIVPGHGMPYDRIRARSQRDYFAALLRQFEQYYTDKITPQELCRKIDVEEYIDNRPILGWIMAVNTMINAEKKKKK